MARTPRRWRRRPQLATTPNSTLFDAIRDVAVEKFTKAEADPQAGSIHTAWNQIQIATLPAEPQADRRHAYSDHTPPVATRYYIRFDVTVIEPRPYRVAVVGHAAKLQRGDALPVELRGGDEPSWLGPRTDAFVLAIHDRIKQYAPR